MSNNPGQGRKPKASTIIENSRERTNDDRMPPCPSWISLEAKRIWRREAPALHKLGLLTYVDGPAFANYCLIRAQLKQAYEELGDTLTCTHINKNGCENEVARPQVAIIHKCIEQINTLSARFGMTPADRVRIPKRESVKKQPALHSQKLFVDPRQILQEALN